MWSKLPLARPRAASGEARLGSAAGQSPESHRKHSPRRCEWLGANARIHNTRPDPFDWPPSSNSFRFSTKLTDEESGLNYYGHRYYSATLGRFINRDPIEEAGGLNLYGFCLNNPITGYDKLGMVTIWEMAQDLGFSEQDAETRGAYIRQMYADYRNPDFTETDPYESFAKLENRLDRNSAAIGTRSAAGAAAAAAAAAPENGNSQKQTLVGRIFHGILGAVTGGAKDVMHLLFGPPKGAPKNGFDAGAPNNDCAIIAVQELQRAMGMKPDSRDTIIKNFGLPANQFGPEGPNAGDGIGLVDRNPNSDQRRSTAQLLNAALNPSGLAVDWVPQGFTASGDFVRGTPFGEVVAKGQPMIMGTIISNPAKNFRSENHLVTAVPIGPKYDSVKIYNPLGAGGSVTMTVDEAIARDWPTNAAAGSAQIWLAKRL